jgi:hypothetical protein
MIVLFVLTRNEAELLRLNLAHHLGWGFDHVAIADNESSDATQDVLQQFGDAVTATRIGDPYERYLALSRLLATIEERHGAADWVAVSDTDEFWWTPDSDLPRLLSRIPDGVIAVNSDQKLFLPTELDSVAGPVYCRRTFRTSGAKSPLHTSYIGGKSLYRAAWVRSHGVSNPHWSAGIPHGLWRFDQLLVHHYMIDDEDSFVAKVKTLERWNPQVRDRSETGTALHDPTPSKEQPANIRAFKTAWWRLYEAAGEAGLRDYYRREYVISASCLPTCVQRGELVEDTEFAKFKRSNPDDR